MDFANFATSFGSTADFAVVLGLMRKSTLFLILLSSLSLSESERRIQATDRQAKQTGSPSGDVVFDATPRSINIGDVITLRWVIQAGMSATIPEIGKFDTSGTTEIESLKSSKTLVLIAESASAVTVKTVEIRVLGGKGDEEDFERQLTLFRYPYPAELKHGVGDSVNLITKRLQATFGFIYRITAPTESSISIQTNHLKAVSVQAGLPPQYAARRISYLIEVTKGAAKTAKMVIRAFIERKRVIEDTWYPEPNDDLYKSQVDSLAKSLTE